MKYAIWAVVAIVFIGLAYYAYKTTQSLNLAMKAANDGAQTDATDETDE